MRSPERRVLVERALEQTLLDYVAAALAVTVLVVLAHFWAPADVLAPLSSAQRADLYSKVLGPLSIVASVATAALAVYSSGQGPRMGLLRGLHGDVLIKQFRGAAVAPGIAVVALLIAYVADLGHQVAWARWLAIGASLLVLLRAVRVIFYYTGLLVTAAADKDPEEPLRTLDEQPLPQRH